VLAIKWADVAFGVRVGKSQGEHNHEADIAAPVLRFASIFRPDALKIVLQHIRHMQTSNKNPSAWPGFSRMAE